VKASVLALVLGVEVAVVLAPVVAAAVPVLAAWVTEADPPWAVLAAAAGTNEMFTVCCLLPESPKAITHESPADVCAVVGGHGYLGASVAGLTPALSVAGQLENRSPEPPQGGPTVPATMVTFPESPPLDEVVMSPAVVGAVHPTGSDSFIEPRVRATVGSPEALLHSRSAPADESSNPDPVTVTTEPPFRQVPGFAVMLGPEPVDEVDFASQGTVVVVAAVVVVVVGFVVVVVLAVVVVLPPEVVVVEPPPDVVVVVDVDWPLNVMSCVSWAPPETPNAMTHESPEAIWAEVGGHGYLAASVAESPPLESVGADVGGPTVPVVTVKLPE